MSVNVDDKKAGVFLTENELGDIKELLNKIDFFQDQSDECLERYCENLQTTLGHCRYHYIKNWKEIKNKQEIFKNGKFFTIILELIQKYPVKNLEAMSKDLSGDKVFFQVLKDLNIESNYQDDELSDDVEDDITAETRTYGGSTPSRHNYDDEEEY